LQYYWKIVAKDSKGATSSGPVWSFTTQSNNGTIPTDGLLLYYPFTDGDIYIGPNGKMIKDYSSYHNDGVLNDVAGGNGPTPTSDRHQVPNRALNFNGNGYILINNVIHITNKVTFSFWTKHSSKATLGIISKRNGDWGPPYGDASNNNWQVASEIGGLLSLALWGTSEESKPTNTMIARGEWTHIAIIWDGSEVRHYVNSILVFSFPNSGNVNDNDHQTRIGDDWWGNYFIGNLDDIRIYNRALTQQEITALYNE